MHFNFMIYFYVYFHQHVLASNLQRDDFDTRKHL